MKLLCSFLSKVYFSVKKIFLKVHQLFQDLDFILTVTIPLQAHSILQYHPFPLEYRETSARRLTHLSIFNFKIRVLRVDLVKVFSIFATLDIFWLHKLLFCLEILLLCFSFFVKFCFINFNSGINSLFTHIQERIR